MEINQKFRKQTELCQELLTGSICYTSRKKIMNHNNYHNSDTSLISFGTLHSLTAKITKSFYLEEDMRKIVELAMLKYVSVFSKSLEISDKTVQDYYLAIRHFINGDNNNDLITQEEPVFYQIYNLYLSLKDTRWDWEDSLMIASNYLDDDLITPSFFPFDNLVLVNLEKVITPNNSNAFNFYLSLCNYFYRHHSCNCYFLTKDNILYKYNGGGELLTSVNHKEVPQQIGFI